jgi:hypothetical protein
VRWQIPLHLSKPSPDKRRGLDGSAAFRTEELRCSTANRCYSLLALRKTVSAHNVSIALLPFESLSPSASDSWLVIGLAQD